MTAITLEEARLIIKRWAESSALLLVATSCLVFSFCVLLTGPPPLQDLLLPVGKVALIELAR
jgi:hypothetical protein